MLIRNITAEHIYLACGYTDMRKSIDGLAALVAARFHLDPHQPALFLFCGRRKDRIKALLWDETGFLLLYKRLENGRYQWPNAPEDLVELSQQQLRWAHRRALHPSAKSCADSPSVSDHLKKVGIVSLWIFWISLLSSGIMETS